MRARDGDEAAFTAIVQRYQDALARHLARLTGDWALAEDLTQDTVIQAYRSLPQKQPDASLSAWLYRAPADPGACPTGSAWPTPAAGC